MQLSQHFSLEVLTASDTAARAGIDNTPDAIALANLKRLAVALESVRGLLNSQPIHINSGYRSVDLNRKVGGQKMSAHLSGLAADLICPSFGTPVEICRAIRDSDIQFDQVIHEFGSWCHFAIAHDGLRGRMDCLTIDSDGTRMGLGD